MRTANSKRYRYKIEILSSRSILTALYSLTLLIPQTLAAEPSDRDKGRLQEAVISCFMVPAGATAPAVIEAHFEDGRLKGTPKIVSKGEGALNEAFANAGVRAILRCEAKIAALAIDGDVRFNFKAEAQEPDGVSDALEEDTTRKLSPEQQQAREQQAKEIEDFLNKRRTHD